MAAAPLPPDVEAFLRGEGVAETELERLADLGLTGISDLDLLARTNRLRDHPGLGPELQARLLAGLRRGRGWGVPRLLDAARTAASRLLTGLQREPSALRLAVSGQVRRMDPFCERVDLVATSASDPGGLLQAFGGLAFVERVVGEGAGWREVVLEDGMRARLSAWADDAAALAALVVGTGPPDYVEVLKARAAERGLRLAEDGLFAGEERVPLASEEEVFERLGLPWRPPEVRRADVAEEAPPPGLLSMTDLKGCFGAHTRRGHGSHGLADMLARAKREGYAWMAVTDRARPDAGPPLTVGDVEAAREEGRRAAEADLGVGLVVGLEVAVLADGSLDAADDLLAAVDVVVAVVDERDGGDVTERVLSAVAHPRVHVLGRPEGRVLLGRRGPSIDLERVLAACAARGTAVEIHGDPHRLDLGERWHAAAQRLGVKVVVSAAAHDLAGVDQAILGVGCARRGGWSRDDVLNTQGAAGFLAWCRRREVRLRP